MARNRIAQRRRRREEAEFKRLEALASAGGQNVARVAHHEIGHSALLWFQRAAGVFESVTVVQVGDKLGLTRNKWPAQKTRAQMRALICVQIAGKVAEERAFETSLLHGVDQQNWIRTARAVLLIS
uniref:Peptidase M41 domain-containing protein n=1 Tax=Globodera rostochiensis TaxID=31243 RepID=A0A914HE15_GLORO